VLALDLADKFLRRVSYVHGSYDDPKSYEHLASVLNDIEHSSSEGEEVGPANTRCFLANNRIFYFALPPFIFIKVASFIRRYCWTKTGFNRAIIEKPFGRDLESAQTMIRELSDILKENEMYRIDHYLGKEMVVNLMYIRFANMALSSMWHSNNIASVVITFKEPFGTLGRGGYFDKFGIIRDVIQNHLLQVLTIVAMERPVSLESEDIRDEKVKVLKSIPPVLLENTVIGQYGTSLDGKEVAYLDDPGVPKDSTCPTFASMVLFVQNERWDGVPFILKGAKAVNERKAEVRIQFKSVPGQIFRDLHQNELVVRIQPDEAIYLKIQTKKPGFGMIPQETFLDLSYKERFPNQRAPEAYEKLLLDVLRGESGFFVRSDELEAAWRIFTPILHELEEKKVQPIPYVYGSRGPVESDALASRFGFTRSAESIYPHSYTSEVDSP